MGGYTKNIAVIKGIKDGFSADGGALSGLIKTEKYGDRLHVEVTYINFAPLSEGRYVCALTDGNATEIVENGEFDGASKLVTGNGFAALICYIHGQVSPIASAVCGNFAPDTLKLKAEVERIENAKAMIENNPNVSGEDKKEYEDEAIAEVNYYEYEQTFKDGGALRADKTQEKNGGEIYRDEAAFGAVEEEQNGVNGGYIGSNDKHGQNREKRVNAAYMGGNKPEKDGKTPENAAYSGGNEEIFRGGLAGGGFYEKTKEEIEGVLKSYPAAEELENLLEGSRFVKISYDGEKHYVFGVLYDEGKPKYLCYGVPSGDGENPPESMAGMASFIPLSENGGYWLMYQDAETGASLKVGQV